jgi:chromosome segregation ATPase
MLKVSGELELTAIEQINAEHHACEAAVRSSLKHAVRCGALLEEQKATVNHGGWLTWLEENFDGSARTAQVYMRLSRSREAVEEAANAQRSAHLSIDGALRALDAPKEPSEAAPEDSEHVETHKRKASHHADELREQLGKERQRAERERERAERERERSEKTRKQIEAEVQQQVEAEKAEYQKNIDTLYSAEMAELKAKYGDIEEPRFAHIPPEEWERQIREAKSQRVIDVTKHLNELYGWPEWMGRYWPEEAIEAIEDMEGKEDVRNGIEFIDMWLGKVIDGWEE